MKILVITSCTGEKLHSPQEQLRQDDFWHLHVRDGFTVREDELADFRTPAEEIYTGQQHTRLMKGIRFVGEQSDGPSVTLWIVSAGYGLIPAAREIVPYECTFQGMKTSEIDEWANHLAIPATARKLFSENFDLVIVLLGEGYLRALRLDDTVHFAAPTLFLTSKNSQKFVKGRGAIRIVPLTNKDTKRFSCGLVGLKGEIAARLLRWLSVQTKNHVTALFDPNVDVLSLLEGTDNQKPSTGSGGRASRARPNPAVDWIVQLPTSWQQRPHRDKLLYFIPEWDDLVDLNYDFERDLHSGGQGDWSNEVYAHQMYPEPNYDGILVSKVVAEKSAKKRERINEMGVHRYVRVPREFPIMGDCGAFGYIKEETPPYTTDDILDYYTRLGFDYGVSIDHLIVTATEEQKQFRYDLTIHNAEEFLREHRQRALQWEPVGAVQGWDPKSYAEAARQYEAMGYSYIALGGLVRTSTEQILQVLHEVHQNVSDSVRLHLFGIARLNALRDFQSLGVRSIDSASHLRRAWLGSNDNYWTLSGEKFAAIRIPEAGKSFRAKRIVEENRASADEVMKLEKASMKAMREYAKGGLSVDEVLAVLDEFDHMITPDRPSMSGLYRKTLEARPWESCPCQICQQDGVEVVIFRGNNRNRRRGFHNTFVFYRLFEKVLTDEIPESATSYQIPLL